MDKATVLATIRINRVLFESIVGQVNEERMIEPLEVDQRSGKDILAHTTAWEQRLIGWLEATARGEAPQIPESGATWDDMDRLNEQTFEQNRNRSLADVMTNSQRSFQQLLKRVDAFSEEDLIEPGRFAWLDEQRDGDPLWKAIVAGPGCMHYQDHLFDFLRRTDPAKLFTPDPAQLQHYAGTYVSGEDGLSFRAQENLLLLTPSWTGEEIPVHSTIALDETRITYEDFGTITFHVASNGSVPSVEWWAQVFTRV